MTRKPRAPEERACRISKRGASKFASGLPEFAAVDELIRSRLVSDAPRLTENLDVPLELGGKRMRPLLSCSPRAPSVRPPPRRH